MTGAYPSSSAFLFLDDALATGPDALCAELDRLGFDGVTPAVAYHEAADLRPRGHPGHLTEAPAGACYFPPAPGRYGDGLAAWAPAPFDKIDVYAELRGATETHGLTLTAWTVFLHNARLGAARPDCCQITALGDVLGSDLCPTGPAVRAYAVALARDVLARRPDALLAESLHFHPWREGRRFVPMDAAARLALGLCFCAHCTAAAEAASIDLEAVRRWARERIEAALAGRIPETDAVLDPAALADLVGGQLVAFLRLRCQLVHELVAEVADVAHDAGARMVMMDQAGVETPALSTRRNEEAFRYGVDPALYAGTVDGWQVLAYGPDAATAGATVAGYREVLAAGIELRATLRPSWPDSAGSLDLAAKVEAVTAAGAQAVDFYNLSLAPTDAFPRAGAVMRARRKAA